MMKNLFLLILFCITATAATGMETLLKCLSGEQIIEYVPATKDERETPIKLWNQTGKVVELQATYACKARLIYTGICCFGDCLAIPGSYIGTTSCEDNMITCNNQEVVVLVPQIADLKKSFIELKSLIARYKHKSASWINLSIPDRTQQAHNSYQNLCDIITDRETFTLIEQFGNPVIEK